MEGLAVTLTQIPDDVQPASSQIHCCCGRPDCVLLKRNCSALESVEKDVHTAAQLGQVRFFLLFIIGYTIASCLLHSKHQPPHYNPRCLYRLMANRDPLHL